MLVPQNRLLFWFALIVVPLSLLVAAEPLRASMAGTAIAAFAAITIWDAFRARRKLAGFGIQLPGLLRMSRNRPARLELRVQNRSEKSEQVRVALALPPEVTSDSDEVPLHLPAGTEWSRTFWNCIPRQRGRFRVPFANLEVNSPLHLWCARKTLPTDSEIRVYPNLIEERRTLAHLFLHRGLMGIHAQRQLGKGREFEKLREYSPGDSFDEIHWKATARRGKPITKTFQIERTQEIYVVLDTSRLSGRPAPKQAHAGRPESVDENETALERFMTAALVLGLAAEQQGDFFGLITFSDTVKRFVRAKTGKAHYNACRDALYRLEPELISPDYDELCTFIRLRLRRRALLLILTALDDPICAENFVKNINLVSRQHVVLVNMLQPPGVEPIFGGQPVQQSDDLYRTLGGHLVWQKLRELEQVLRRRGVQFSLLRNERLAAQLVTQYLNVKRRQAL